MINAVHFGACVRDSIYERIAYAQLGTVMPGR